MVYRSPLEVEAFFFLFFPHEEQLNLREHYVKESDLHFRTNAIVFYKDHLRAQFICDLGLFVIIVLNVLQLLHQYSL